MQPVKRRLLILSDWFDPAHKAGGPVRSAVNFVKQMKNEFDIFVFTSDRDLNEIKPLEGIIQDKWVDYIPAVKIFYASAKNLTLKTITGQINSVYPDMIYLNSMFSKKFTVFPLWLKRRHRISAEIVLAPRGMLKSSALDFKRRKKRIFLSMFRLMRIPQIVRFHATDEQESIDIVRQFGREVVIHTIPNFSGSQDELSLPVDKRKGFLQVLFIGRIHPIKGLDILLNALRQAKQNILLTIAGNIEIVSFWNVCKKIISELPKNVQVSFEGQVPHSMINQLIRRHHIFCLPTQGENFGHAIFESLAVGRPVLISDQTPWRNLASYKAGWDIPLIKPEKFVQQIEQCALMEQEELNQWCNGAWQYCKKYIESTDIRQQYIKMFS